MWIFQLFQPKPKYIGRTTSVVATVNPISVETTWVRGVKNWLFQWLKLKIWQEVSPLVTPWREHGAKCGMLFKSFFFLYFNNHFKSWHVYERIWNKIFGKLNSNFRISLHQQFLQEKWIDEFKTKMKKGISNSLETSTKRRQKKVDSLLFYSETLFTKI